MIGRPAPPPTRPSEAARQANAGFRAVRSGRCLRAGAALVAAVSLAAPVALAQGQKGPRTPDGRPDLSGVWTNASLTQLTRPPGVKALVVDAEEAKRVAATNPVARVVAADQGPSDVNDGLLNDGNAALGYNAYWLDPGQSLGVVRGQFRTSWIVEPADGQLPLSAAGRARVAETEARLKADPDGGPEALTPWDRCLISSRGAGGPGMLNTIYNSNYRIVQTPQAIAILAEQVHDVRTIDIFPDRGAALAAPRPPPRWLGHSVGWWEGETLVVHTTGVVAEQGRHGPIYLTEAGQVTEWFRRISEQQIHYVFEVVDPAYYARPWRAEMSLNAIKGPIYEFACHEGNYALGGILAGARASEPERAGAGRP